MGKIDKPGSQLYLFLPPNKVFPLGNLIDTILLPHNIIFLSDAESALKKVILGRLSRLQLHRYCVDITISVITRTQTLAKTCGISMPFVLPLHTFYLFFTHYKKLIISQWLVPKQKKKNFVRRLKFSDSKKIILSVLVAHKIGKIKIGFGVPI